MRINECFMFFGACMGVFVELHRSLFTLYAHHLGVHLFAFLRMVLLIHHFRLEDAEPLEELVVIVGVVVDFVVGEAVGCRAVGLGLVFDFIQHDFAPLVAGVEVGVGAQDTLHELFILHIQRCPFGCSARHGEHCDKTRSEKG